MTPSQDEIYAAVMIAATRKVTSDRRRASGRASRTPEHYNERPSWDQEIESTLAEEMVARWRDLYWMGSHFNGRDAGSDVGSAVQVRWTPYHDGHLIVYVEDDPEDFFVLVTGYSPAFDIVGWAQGAECMQERYWREDVKCPAWWVPQSDIHLVNG